MSESITVVGTVGSVPQAHATQSGRHVTSFRLACTPRVRDRDTGEWRDGETNWYSVAVWEQLGKNALESLRKGERAIVTGRLRLRHWEKDARSGMDAEITATALGHDLKWGTAQFTNGARPARQHAEPERRDGGGLADTVWDPRPLVPNGGVTPDPAPLGSSEHVASSGFPDAAASADEDAEEETPF